MAIHTDSTLAPLEAYSSKTRSIPIVPLARGGFSAWLADQKKPLREWVKATGFKAENAHYLLVPDDKNAIASVLCGVEHYTPWSIAHLPQHLPAGTYHLSGKHDAALMQQLALGWALGGYHFTAYRKHSKILPALMLPRGADAGHIRMMAQSLALARDWINQPANAMHPAQLAAVAQQIAREQHGKCTVIEGDALLKERYPAIHAVGRASAVAPRLIDLRWGKTNAPRVTLVGKGVCFDSGGLDIKPSSGMKLMKKDMGGAACVLALARMVMQSNLSLRLRVLIPAVENSISGNAFRPLDIIETRKGLSVEIGNTDAEGRVILCDALTEADREKPELLIDCATLTGAARVALGTDIPAFFTPDDALAAEIERHSRAQHDPLWRLPLWKGYRDMLNSPVADLNNAPESSYAGAITAALYLQEFVSHSTSWLHIDMMAWNLSSRPGRPAGGEAMAVRSLFALLKERYSK